MFWGRNWRSIISPTLIAGAIVWFGSSVALSQESTPIPVVDFSSLGGEIISDGSSTVWPITDEAALRFMGLAEGVEFTIGFSGTGGGFRKFCDGETDIQNASRPIEDDEMASCLEHGVQYYVFEVAYDGITIVVNPKNDFVTCLTVDQLRRLWQPDDPAKTWQDLDPNWPDDEIALFGPGPDSGTFDYFTAAVIGEEGVSRTDYFPSEDDLALVEGVADDESALGYFGYAYFEEEQDRLKSVAVDSGAGCISPSSTSIADGTYKPLSRPLFIYLRASSLSRPEVAGFMRYYLANVKSIASDVGYIASPDQIYVEDQKRLEQAIVGQLPPDGPSQP